MIIRCNKCGFIPKEDVKFCERCGAELKQPYPEETIKEASYLETIKKNFLSLPKNTLIVYAGISIVLILCFSLVLLAIFQPEIFIGTICLLVIVAVIFGALLGGVAPGQHVHHHCCLVGVAYYDPKSKELIILRKWRDEKLMRNKFGRIFVRTYYSLSPVLASFIVNSERLKATTRLIVNPFVHFARVSA